MEETASFVVSESEDGVDWFIIHMDTATFHCNCRKPPGIGCICDLAPGTSLAWQKSFLQVLKAG